MSFEPSNPAHSPIDAYSATPEPLSALARLLRVYMMLSTIAVVVIPVMGAAGAIPVPSLLAGRQAWNESSAKASLNQIHKAEGNYYRRYGEYGTFAELVAERTLDASWEDRVTRDNYTFGLYVTNGGAEFYATAEPLTPADGSRAFTVDKTGAVDEEAVEDEVAR